MNDETNGQNGFIRRGEKAGRIYFVLFILWMGQILMAIVFKNNIVIQGIGAVLNIGVIISYVYLLVGVKALAIEIADASLKKNMQSGIIAGIVTWFVYMVPSFITGNEMQAGLIVLLITAVTSVVFGIISIRIGNDFKRLQEHFGKIGRKVAWWQKVSGYFMVSVILSFVGAFLSLAADYYLWRLLQQRTRSTAISPTR